MVLVMKTNHNNTGDKMNANAVRLHARRLSSAAYRAECGITEKGAALVAVREAAWAAVAALPSEPVCLVGGSMVHAMERCDALAEDALR